MWWQRVKQAIARVRSKNIPVPAPTPTNLELAQASIHQGNLQAQQGDLNQAIASYRQAIALEPNQAEFHLGLGCLLLPQGQLIAAQDSFQQAIALNRQLVEAHIQLGNLFVKQQQLELAITYYQQAIALDGNRAEVHLGLGHLFIEQKNLEAAKQSFQQAISLNSQLVEAHIQLGNLFVQQQQLEFAIGCYQQVIKIDVTHAGAHFALGNLLIKQGELKQATACYRQAIAWQPDWMEIYLHLGNVLTEQGEWEEAIAIYQKALTLHPNLPNIQLKIGNLQAEQGRIAEAIAIYKQTTINSLLVVDQLTNAPLIVLVADLVLPRVCKIAYGLKSIGWQVILLYQNAPFNEPEKYCDRVYIYHSPAEALAIARQFHPIVYHIFSVIDFVIASLFIHDKPGKIVFDDYDVMAGMMKEDWTSRHFTGQMQLEKFCLENADGLCCRSIEMQYSRRCFEYKYRGKRIFFADYCWNFPNITISTSYQSTDDAIHVVYAGNIPYEKSQKPSNYLLLLAETLAQHKIHYHIYPAPHVVENFKTDLLGYIQLSDQSPFFHLHQPLDNEDMIEEFTQYDLGLSMFGQEHSSYHQPYHVQQKFEYCMANKLYDYLDAGLPYLIVKPLRFLRFLANRDRVGIDIEKILSLDRSHLKQTIIPALKKSAEQAKIINSIERQIIRLRDFYLAL